MSSFKLLGEAIIHTQYRLARGSPFHPKIISSYAINRTREAALAFQDCKRVRPRRDMADTARDWHRTHHAPTKAGTRAPLACSLTDGYLFARHVFQPSYDGHSILAHAHGAHDCAVTCAWLSGPTRAASRFHTCTYVTHAGGAPSSSVSAIDFRL